MMSTRCLSHGHGTMCMAMSIIHWTYAWEVYHTVSHVLSQCTWVDHGHTMHIPADAIHFYMANNILHTLNMGMRRRSCICTDGFSSQRAGPCACGADHGDAYFLVSADAHSMHMVMDMPECMYMTIHDHGHGRGPMGMHRRQCVAGLASESDPAARGRQWARIPAPNGIKPARSSPHLLIRIPAFCYIYTIWLQLPNKLVQFLFLPGLFLPTNERSTNLTQSARSHSCYLWRFVPIGFLVGFFVRGSMYPSYG